MPVMWLNAHAEALTELQAEESMRAAETIAFGAGKMKKSDHEKVLKRLRATAGQETGTRIKKTADISKLLSLGIEVRNESR